MRFIELTTASTGITIWLNTSHIVGFYYEPTTEATVVTVHGEKDEVQVKESPQQLLAVLGGEPDGRREQLSRTY